MRVATAQSTSVYSYGPTGMREKAVVTSGDTTKTAESVWDGMRLAAEISPLMSAHAGTITA